MGVLQKGVLFFLGVAEKFPRLCSVYYLSFNNNYYTKLNIQRRISFLFLHREMHMEFQTESKSFLSSRFSALIFATFFAVYVQLINGEEFFQRTILTGLLSCQTNWDFSNYVIRHTVNFTLGVLCK